MKVTSCHTVYGFDDINIGLKIYRDFYGCKVTHHPELPGLDYYVVEDASGNRTDLVSGTNVKDDDHWVRINVDDFDEAMDLFTRNGAIVDGEVIDTPFCKMAFVRTGRSKANRSIVFAHKSK